MGQKYSSILFDMDGTLIDSRADLVDAVNHVLAELSYPPQSDAEIISRIGNGLRQLLKDTLHINDAALLLKAKVIFERYYHDHCTDKTIPYDGVVETLKSFSGRYRMAVVTNKPFAFSEKILIELGLRPLFSSVIGGDSTPETKPHPAPLYLAMKEMGAQPNSTLMVGDGIQDVQGAKAADVAMCVVRYGFGFRPELLELKPNYTITEFIQLKEIVS